MRRADAPYRKSSDLDRARFGGATGWRTFGSRSVADNIPIAIPASVTRYVALGDSVPYGHGLNNPYITAQIGLPKSAVSQGPSLQAWPSLVQKSLKLSMSVRPTNCRLTGDQLSISGAQASARDASTSPAPRTEINYQCPGIRNVQTTEIPGQPRTKPAALVTIRPARTTSILAAALKVPYRTVCFTANASHLITRLYRQSGRSSRTSRVRDRRDRIGEFAHEASRRLNY